MTYALPNLVQDDAPPRRLRVLVADDDEINRRVLVHILIRLSHEVRVASSGLEALMEVAAGFFDVLFMDLHMPDLGGLEATRLITSAWTPERRLEGRHP
jgi:CheY-like chemotaxis protein